MLRMNLGEKNRDKKERASPVVGLALSTIN